MSLQTDNRNPAKTTSPRSPPPPWRELASRHSAGVAVGLYWQPDVDEVFVRVADEETGEIFVFEPPKSAALSATTRTLFDRGTEAARETLARHKSGGLGVF